MEDRPSDYDFFLIEASSPKAAREVAIQAFFDKAMRQGGTEFIIEYAFEAFSGFEYDDEEEIFQFFGQKDGQTVLSFYEKYTWDAFMDGEVKFYKGFAPEDQDKFYSFDIEILKKLYKQGIWYDVLVMPITKDFSKGKKPEKAKLPSPKTIEEYMKLPYKIELIPDEEGGFVTSYPDLPGCLSSGKTIEAAYTNAIAAKREWLAAAIEEGISIREPSM